MLLQSRVGIFVHSEPIFLRKISPRRLGRPACAGFRDGSVTVLAGEKSLFFYL